MKKRRIASALLSGTMLMSMCCFGASAAESKTDVIIFGDLNLDGSVNLLDAIASQKYIAKTLSLDEVKAVDESLLDINKDGAINLLDAIALQKHLVALDVKDYIGKILYKWVVDYKEVQVKVVDKPAYTYEEPVYDYDWVDVCNQCGKVLGDNPVLHYVDNDSCISYHTEKRNIQVGTKTVTVPEEFHYETKKVENGGHWEYK